MDKIFAALSVGSSLQKKTRSESAQKKFHSNSPNENQQQGSSSAQNISLSGDQTSDIKKGSALTQPPAYNIRIMNFDPSIYEDLSMPSHSEDQKANHNSDSLVKLLSQKGKVQVKIDSFETFGLLPWLIRNICQEMTWSSPTSIQQVTIPVLLHQRDVLVTSPTGSGKTAAFLLPALQLAFQYLQENPFLCANNSPSESAPSTNCPIESPPSSSPLSITTIYSLILSPTKDLCKQIYRQALRLSTGQHMQIGMITSSLKFIKPKINHYDVLIATPFIAVSMYQKYNLPFSSVRFLVLDEIDSLLSDDFVSATDSVLSFCDYAHKVTAMFSATLNFSVEFLAKSILKDHVKIVVGHANTPASHVNQYLKYTGSEDGKLLAINDMFVSGQKPPILIFMQSKHRAQQLTHLLSTLSVSVDYITGDRTEIERQTILEKFRRAELSVLVTTDLLARGLDFRTVSTVINYDMPTSTTMYIHRIGRTGRVGGLSGTSWTLFTDADIPYIKPIVNVMAQSGQLSNIPAWLLRLNNPSKRVKAQLSHSVVNRDDVIPQPKTTPINPGKFDTFRKKGLIDYRSKKRGSERPHKARVSKKKKTNNTSNA
ncbi:uncharacterized protein LOC126322610 [Schistocerca gregaria]|uniref:uncharacterized protein LOC126322610 n=1 Tax=Schistocerca gregaria TaxID=7010 RepID=UPI00211DC799|nr:uncharacterized protein LOC126322610 [Schistocerca gregaria]